MFKDTDFKNLTWKIHEIDESSKIELVIPTIKLYPEFNVPLSVSKIKVIKYIVYLYDSNTPLRVIDNFFTRKKQAADLAKFPKDDNGDYDKDYEDIVFGKNKEVNRMVIRYCRVQRSPQMAQLVIYEEGYYNELHTLKTDNEMKPSDRVNLLKNIDTIATKIEQLSGRFLSGDDGATIKGQLFDEIENEELQLTPEDIALKLETNEKPLGDYNPYR